MLLINRRLATGLLLVSIGGIRFAGAAPDATARITFILVKSHPAVAISSCRGSLLALDHMNQTLKNQPAIRAAQNRLARAFRPSS